MVNIQQMTANILRAWVNGFRAIRAEHQTAGPVAPAPLAAASTSSACSATETYGQTLGNALDQVRSDCRPHDAHELAAIHRLLLPDAIRFEHAVLLVRGQCDGEFVFGFEFVLRRYWIG